MARFFFNKIRREQKKYQSCSGIYTDFQSFFLFLQKKFETNK